MLAVSSGPSLALLREALGPAATVLLHRSARQVSHAEWWKWSLKTVEGMDATGVAMNSAQRM